MAAQPSTFHNLSTSLVSGQGEQKAGGTSLSSAWQVRDKEQNFSDPLLDLIATRFRLLSEPLRLKILAALIVGEQNVGGLVALTGAGQANISKHLAALTQGGLVTRRKVGTSSYYAIADLTIVTLCDVVCAGVQEGFAAQARRLGLSTSSGGIEERPSASTSHEEIKE